MKTITKQGLVEALVSVGLKKSDAVLVHSDISRIGPIEGCSSRQAYLEAVYEAFLKVIGSEGTLVVPAYFLDYGRFEAPFDISRSPVSSSIGVFAQYVRTLPAAIRSPNPILGLSAIGKQAKYICCGGTASSYGVDSPFDRLMRLGGKILFFGIDMRNMTFVHYVEHMVGVPHKYTKLHTIPIFEDGHPIDLPVCSQVRYLDFDIEYDQDSFTSKFEKAGLVTKKSLGMGLIRCVSCNEVFDFLKEKLKKDFFYLLKRIPKFVAGRVPMDGCTGQASTGIPKR